MENSKNHNVNLGVSKFGKNIKKNQQKRNRNSYPQSEEVYIVDKDNFKKFVQHMTGKEIIHSKPPLETML
jgi:hypothetical protein